jgi:hypothetical protein
MVGPWELSWELVDQTLRRVVVRFVTPMELKTEGRVLRHAPPFAVLVARVRDRLSSLALRYGEPSETFDYRGLVERTRSVRMVESCVTYRPAGRFSTRTGNHHTLGGFTGYAVYEGPVGESVGLLRAAYWTGAGRQTVWGHGALIVE